jgi:cyclopropane fatty-acyl-phospholipid synthase-like methyltransferase
MTGAGLDRLNNLCWEGRLGVSTRGLVPIDYPDSVHYATIGFSTVRSILRHLELQPSDVFVDIGCGKGRVLCCAARYEVKQVIGVDLSADLSQDARANAKRLRGRKAPIVVKTLPAHEFDYSAATVLFMFDPFGASTMASVLAKIGSDREGRSVRIAYANPTQEAVFRQESWLDRREFWPKETTGLEHSVVFYEGDAPQRVEAVDQPGGSTR